MKKYFLIGILFFLGCASQYMTAGRVYRQQENYDKAIEQFNLQLEMVPQDADALWEIGLTYVYKEDYEEACKYIDKVKKISPDKEIFETKKGVLWLVYYNAGIFANQDKDFELAKQRFTQASEFEPDSVSTYMNLAIVYSNLEKEDSALVCYKRAIEIAPDNVEAHRNIGIEYKNIKEYDLAIEHFKKALDVESENADILYLLGVCHYLKENYKEAEITFLHTIECDSTLEDAYFNLGAIFVKEKKYDKGIELFKKVIEFKPDDIEALNQLAVIYLATKKYDLAVETYTKIIKIDEESREAYIGRANAYWKLGKKKEANADSRKMKDLK